MKHEVFQKILNGWRGGAPEHSRSAVRRYGSGVVALVLATLVRWLFDPLLGDSVPFPTYFMAIMFVACYGGLRPALVTTLGGAFLADYLFTAPRGMFFGRGYEDVVAFGLYLTAGVTISVLGDALAVSRRRYQMGEKRLQSLLKIAQHKARSVRELIDYALEESLAFSGSQLGYIYYYSEEREEFTLHAWSREVMAACAIPNPPTVYRLKDTGLWGEAVRQRRPLMENDFAAPHPLKKGYPEGHAPLRRFMTLPVVKDGRIVAVVGVANKPADYTAADLRQLTLMMDSIWEIAERKRAEEQLAAELAINLAMSALSAALIAPASSIREVTDITLHYAKLLTGSEHGFVSVIDPVTGDNVSETLTAMLGNECLIEGAQQRVAFPVGPDGRYGSLWGHALNRQQAFFTNAPQTHEASSGVPTGHVPVKNFLSVPAMLGDRLVGQVALANSHRDYTQEDLEVIEHLTSLYAVALGRKETEDTLRRAHAENRALSGKLLTAQEEERRRLAREMHDDLTQRLAVLAIEAGKLEKELGGAGAVPQRLREMTAQLIDLSRDMHGLSRQLHPSILDDLGLADALRSECARFSQREKIAVRCEFEQAPHAIPKDVALGLYRIAQEALRNVAKHARAAEASVSLATTPSGVMLSVEDAGSGFDRARTRGKLGLGLASMEERARLIGGELSIASEPGKGTLIEVWAPLTEEAA